MPGTQNTDGEKKICTRISLIYADFYTLLWQNPRKSVCIRVQIFFCFPNSTVARLILKILVMVKLILKENRLTQRRNAEERILAGLAALRDFIISLTTTDFKAYKDFMWPTSQAAVE
ncbi:MAG: hypothetical protein R3A44_18680 [Caldilineaceae bacterium]